MCVETGCILTLQGHPRSLILAPIESVYMTAYYTSNLGPILLRFRDIRAFVHQKPLFWYPSPIPAKISGCSPWTRSVMLGSAESEHPRITNGEIIFEDFQPMWSAYLNVTDGQMDRQTTCRSNTTLRVASHSKNCISSNSLMSVLCLNVCRLCVPNIMTVGICIKKLHLVKFGTFAWYSVKIRVIWVSSL